MIELLLIPIAILAFLLWQERRDRREESAKAQKLLTATLDEWSEDRNSLLEQAEQTRKELTAANHAERQEWISERRELMNRIQAPEHAVTENYEPTIVPAVGFDNDEDFWSAKDELSSNGDS